MNIDVKIRLGLLLASVVIAAAAALPGTHSLLAGFLDEIGGTAP